MGHRLLLREAGSAVRDVFDHALYGLGLTAEPACISVNSQALVRMAEKGLGAAVLPVPVAETGLSRENRMKAAWIREKSMSPQMGRLLELLKKCEG